MRTALNNIIYLLLPFLPIYLSLVRKFLYFSFYIRILNKSYITFNEITYCFSIRYTFLSIYIFNNYNQNFVQYVYLDLFICKKKKKCCLKLFKNIQLRMNISIFFCIQLYNNEYNTI